MDRSTKLRMLLAGLAVAAAGTGAELLRRRRARLAAEVFTDGPLPPIAPPRERRGTPSDRGRRTSIGLDVGRLQQEDEFEPVVQYLTYIQAQRGEDSHLLFVRYDDLDALAELEGQPVGAFLERLEQLGVVVSNN